MDDNINIKTLDKITAKTSTIRLAIGDKKSFGSLQIHGLKCQISEDNQLRDTVAYLQIKDLAAKADLNPPAQNKTISLFWSSLPS